MHEYTRLKMEEFLSKMRTECEDEVDQFAAKWATRGFPLPDGSLISGILEIRLNWLDNLLEKLFDAEKTALSKQGATLSPGLAGEFDAVVQQELSMIRSRALQRFGEGKGPARDAILAITGEKERSVRESINRRVQIMEQELKWGEPKTITQQTIQVSGDVGVLNTGNLQMVNSAITILDQNASTRELSHAIATLSTAIAQSVEMPPEKKNEAIEILGTVASEAVVPKEKRRNAVVRTLLGALPTAIQTGASLMQIWQQVEPIIKKYFQI